MGVTVELIIPKMKDVPMEDASEQYIMTKRHYLKTF